MNFDLPGLPERPVKQRQSGLSMVMDKGLSVRETESFIEQCAPYTDLVKFGFGSSLITNKLEEKIKLYKDSGIKVYFGGTLLEAFIIRNKFDDYLRFIDKFKIDTIEVSDGSITLPHDKKCNYIHSLAKNYTVLSEVGSKEEGFMISPGKWISMMKAELEAGSWKVITEARESGTVGIYRPTGGAHVILIRRILKHIPPEKILWEAPQKSQQVWFIKLIGANVNLGNIAPYELLPLETLRLGLRGDTFHLFLKK